MSGPSEDLSHIDGSGQARMVDVGEKPVTRREARAEARVRMKRATRKRIEAGETPKGAVIEVARLAGIQGAKRTAELIPLCHPLALETADVSMRWDDTAGDATSAVLVIETRAVVSAKTGVEMEALTAASIAALTIYDMLKAIDRGLEIERVRLLEKRGGRSGVWRRDEG